MKVGQLDAFLIAMGKLLAIKWKGTGAKQIDLVFFSLTFSPTCFSPVSSSLHATSHLIPFLFVLLSPPSHPSISHSTATDYLA